MKCIIRIDGKEQDVAQMEAIGVLLRQGHKAKLTLKAVHVSRNSHQPTVNIELTYGGEVSENGRMDSQSPQRT